MQIKYEVEIGDALELKELPFVVGVLGDYSGKPDEALPPVKDRRFVNIDRDNFNDVLREMKPRLAFRVDDKITVGFVHSSIAMTGFVGAVGDSLCVTGVDNGCARGVYKTVGGLVRYRLKAPYAIEGGLVVSSTQPFLADLKLGARCIVQDSQAAVFFRNGKAMDTLKAGTHTLSTENLPILSSLYKLVYNDAPFQSCVYFVSLKPFRELKWGTKEPIMLEDTKFGFVNVRAFGSFSLRVTDPQMFIQTVVGTEGRQDAADVERLSAANPAGAADNEALKDARRRLAEVSEERDEHARELDNLKDAMQRTLVEKDFIEEHFLRLDGSRTTLAAAAAAGEAAADAAVTRQNEALEPA